jgi:DNA invertase Pin-like site-specific DNA recombinase
MEVEIIKAKGAGEDTSTGRKIDRLRVAAYCRVSTDDEDQIKSYNSMVRYYTDLIKSNKQWVFAGVFADKAITGTKTDKREEFQLLIQECLSGNIDLVIAKSIPRFARNTLDTLKYVRMLRERNIAVYFEVEKINTLKDGEFLLTILSSVAQQEVENTSAYVKKGLKMKMKRGELVGFQGCLGYDYDVVTKSLSINEEGAETVRYIFDRCVAGFGDFNKMGDAIHASGNSVTIDGNNGNVYAGLGKIEKNTSSVEEIKLLYELLLVVIKNNIITTETVPLIWRLWDVIVLHKRYRGNDNTKQIVNKKDYEYISFEPPLRNEMEKIFSKLQCVNNANLMIEDFLGFLFSQLSAQVPIGSHYLYMRPLLNPMGTIKYNKVHKKVNCGDSVGIQLTGVEFFNVNRYVDFLCAVKNPVICGNELQMVLSLKG